jgi:hypothetical protein
MLNPPENRPSRSSAAGSVGVSCAGHAARGQFEIARAFEAQKPRLSVTRLVADIRGSIDRIAERLSTLEARDDAAECVPPASQALLRPPQRDTTASYPSENASLLAPETRSLGSRVHSEPRHSAAYRFPLFRTERGVVSPRTEVR